MGYRGRSGKEVGALDLLLTHCSFVALLSPGRPSWHTTHLTTCGLSSVLWQWCYLQALFLGRHTCKRMECRFLALDLAVPGKAPDREDDMAGVRVLHGL